MTRRQAAALLAGLLWLGVGVAELAAQRGSDRVPPGAAAGGQASARASRTDVWFVQDLYARLLRYDFAARRLAAAETGVVPEPEAYLALRVRDIRTDAGASGDRLAGETPSGPTVRLERRTQCHKGDPCHASYVVGWDTDDGGAAMPDLAALVVGPVVRVTTYEVTLTLHGQTREYTAQVRYHTAPEGGGLVPEVVDPVIPGLQQLVDDRAPAPAARWDTYVRTRRYAAVMQRLKGLTRAGKTATPGRSPIGFLPGDDVTPQNVAMAMMAPESCDQQGECTGASPVASYSPDPYPLDTANLSASTRDAITCLGDSVRAAGGSFTVTSGYRPQAYQDHLQEVWDKWQQAKNWVQPRCMQLKAAIQAEWDLHVLKHRPVDVSDHTAGNAFDARITLPAGSQTIDQLAAACNLSRPDPDDDVHFRR